MAKITPKDNFMKLVGGGHPEYVPYFTMMGEGYLGEVADVMMSPAVFGDTFFMDGGKDMWGVPYRATEETGWRSGDTFFCYADLAELYFDEGIRFLFLDTGDGVSYAEEVYDIPAADGETVTLDDVAAYLRSLLGTEEQEGDTQLSENPQTPAGTGEAS